MYKGTSRVLIAAVTGVVALTLASFMFPGCTEQLSGEKFENQAPRVWFVNVPPEDNPSSTNPIINWVGQDADGQVVMYRYIVFTEIEISLLAEAADSTRPVTIPVETEDAQYFVDSVLGLQNLVPDSTWTYLEVDHEEGNPQTSVIVPMKAEIDNPVNQYVRQYVYVQAFDELGLGSEIVFRAFQRNDNPPDTRIVGFLGGPYINSEYPTGAITGVPMRWQGSDVVDYPTDPPPFEFEWRLYGPYYSQKYGEENDTIPDTTWEDIVNDFIKVVFVTTDARRFLVGENLSFDDCDTSFEVFVNPTDPPVLDTNQYWSCDTTVDDFGNQEVTCVLTTVTCETILIDTIQASGPIGYLDTLLDISDTAFITNPDYNRIAMRSYDPLDLDNWIDYQQIILYDVYADKPSDTTIEEFYIFWVRSRDDAKVPDLTPDFVAFSVINPKYERDVGVVDLSISFAVNKSYPDSGKVFWNRVIEYWEDATGTQTNWDLSYDYRVASAAVGWAYSLRRMLSNKMLIAINDNPYAGALNNPPTVRDLYTAIDAGVSVWLCGRAHIMGQEAGAPDGEVFGNLAPLYTDPQFGFPFYFGVENMVYSGWNWFLLTQEPIMQLRIEDFVGALSLDESKWPSLKIDTALLHRRYMWRDHYPWRPDIAAMPEVNWFVRSTGFNSQPMYIYESKYGQHHWLNDPMFDFHGRPVMSRVNMGYFRTVHSMFLPYAFEESSSFPMVSGVLSWLYARHLSAPPSELGSRDAAVSVTAEEIGERFWNRMKEQNRDRLARDRHGLER
ncbi:MAG: hypothetical protein JSU65_07775 [Candidatus Zixiibacteriota bacterium]|nr:MAG: hypothetical protein JSU65_07775 [candidate division Zixibacteria bacterium]